MNDVCRRAGACLLPIRLSADELSPPGPRSVEHVQVATSTSGVVTWAVGTRRTISGQISFLVKSTDLGAHWQQVLPATPPITAVDFLDSRRASGIGSASDAGQILSTTDGGQSWTMLANRLNATAISFVDPLHGWLAGDDGSAGDNARFLARGPIASRDPTLAIYAGRSTATRPVTSFG